MRTSPLLGLFALAALALPAGAEETAPPPDWHLNATIIEACSCPMFCQCFFNTSPASHHSHGGGEEAFCLFNNAFQVNAGYYGETDLAGAKFWAAGDLGDNFADGQVPWIHVVFDEATTEAQRAGIGAALTSLYPVTADVFTTSVGTIEWVPGEEESWATVDGGQTAEVRLKRSGAAAGSGPIVIHNLSYFGEDSNDGFILMPSALEAWRGSDGQKTYEFENTNGFMITVDIRSHHNEAVDAEAMESEGHEGHHEGMGG